jgi:hypothetical protein
MKNHKFSYDVSTITGFSDEVGGMLLSQSLVGATTPQYSNVRLGDQRDAIDQHLDL